MHPAHKSELNFSTVFETLSGYIVVDRRYMARSSRSPHFDLSGGQGITPIYYYHRKYKWAS
jgi:hypothetical protein